MKTILFFTKEYQHYSLPTCGGTGIFYKNIADNLVKKGFKVIIFTINNKAFDITENGVRIIAINNHFKLNFFQKLKRSIYKRLNKLKDIEQEIHEKEFLYITKQIKKFITNNQLDIDIIETPSQS